MNFSEMEMKDLEARIAEITAEATEERTLEELTAYKDEKKAIEEEIAKRKADEAERRSIAAEIASNAVDITPVTEKKEERKMSEIEMRNTPEYINAYAEYIKTGDDTECRALLSTNATSGKVAIPTVVYDITKTAWSVTASPPVSARHICGATSRLASKSPLPAQPSTPRVRQVLPKKPSCSAWSNSYRRASRSGFLCPMRCSTSVAKPSSITSMTN